jgi:hypothetical protein
MAIQITTSNFISSEPMNKAMKDSAKEIHKMQCFRFKKNSPYQFFYKTLNKAKEFNITDLRKPVYTGRTPLKVHFSPFY